MRKLILKRLYVQYNYQIKKQSFKNKKPVRPCLRHSVLSRLATKPRSVARYVISQDFGYPNAIFPGVASPNLSHTNDGGEWRRPPDHNSNTLFADPVIGKLYHIYVYW